MYYTEQQKKKQEILQRLKNQQQLSEQRARQEEFGLDDFLKAGNGINTASKHASNVGKYLSKSNNSLVSNFGEKLNTIGNYGQKMTGEGVKQSISNALKSKLGLGAKASTPAVNSAISSTAPSAASTAGTIGSGATSAGLTGASVGTGAATGATGSALGSAIGAEVAGTAGAAGSSALGSAMSAAAPSAASAVGAGAAGAGAAGAGAAGAGAAAAGAGAAGAGAGAAALGALGPVGAALAAGYMIYNMIKSAKKKQQAKQMQVSAQAAQDNMQQAAAKKAEAMQSLQPQVAQPQQVPSYIPEASTQEEVVEPQLEQPVEEETSPLDMLTEGLTPDGETSDLGDITGGAAPVDLEATKASLMDKLRTGVGNISNASQSGLDRLASGLNDFAAGYKDNATTSITEGDLYKRLMPSSTEQAGETQTEDGAYVLSADEKKKNLMNRLGEAVGTGRRIVAHPLTQGVVAGLAYGKSEDDPLYGLGKGVEWTQGKAKSDYYQRKIDPNSIPSIMGGYSEKDYNADTLSKYRDTMAEKNRQAAILAQRKQEYDENMKNQQLAEEQSMNTARINNWSEGNKLARERFEYQKKQDAEAKEEKRRKTEEEGLANGSLIRVVSPDGKTGIIPASEWKNAKKMGAKRI